jgi:neutral ceramidase
MTKPFFADFPIGTGAATPRRLCRFTLAPLFLLALFVALVTTSSPAMAQWKVGLATQSITPERPMWMSGYGSRDQPADGKLTELWAKAMAIEDAAGTRSVLVTLDLVGIDRPTAGRITDALMRQHDLPRSAIAISTSHTHSGPVVGENLRAMYFMDDANWQLVQQYTGELETKVVEVVGRAIEAMRPATLQWTVGRATFAVNRRNNVEADVPKLRASDSLMGPVDHDVPILVVKDDGGAIRGIVCGYACHATVLSGYQWCGDWPGYAQTEIEQRFPGAVALVWAGCGADQNPLPRREIDLAKQYGAAIGAAVGNAVGGRLHDIGGSIDTRYAEIPLAYASLPDRQSLMAAANSSDRYEASRARLLIAQWDRDGGLAADYPYPVQTWRLGDGPMWVFLGGEVVVDFALRLKQELGAGKTWVAGYSNDVMAYIASRRVLAEGGYEGAGAMLYYGLPSPWDASSEEDIIGTVRAPVASLGGPAADAARSIPNRPYPDHSDLTVYHDENGQPHPIETADDWQRRRADILASMQLVMGRLPGEDEMSPLAVRELATEDFGGYKRITIRYTADGDREVPAHLYVPKGDAVGGKRPAVLALHPTSSLGKLIVAGDGPLANRNYAVELAERGYVVLAPDYPSFGDLADYDFHTDDYVSGTMTAIVNHRRGVDVLSARDDVDPEKIGTIGHSLGGHNSMFVGVFDPRIKAVVSSCGWDPFHYYYGGKIAGWSSDRYMPRIREVYGLSPDRMPFDFYEVAAAIAPRGFFSCSPLHDENFVAAGVKEAEPKIRAVYELHGAKNRFVVEYPDAQHDFPPATRMQAYEFLDRVLGVGKTD